MIQEFVDKFTTQQSEVKSALRSERPDGYDDIVKRLVTVLHGSYGSPDPERIHVIDDGSYQGLRLFIVGADGYQPTTYWVIAVNYGSCSVCDAFEANRAFTDEVTDKEVDGNWTMMLHMVQQMREITGE